MALRLKHSTRRSEFSMQRALAVECDQPHLHPPSSSSLKCAPGLQEGLVPEMLFLPIASGLALPAALWSSCPLATYFSHMHLRSVNSHQYGARCGSTISARNRFASLALERGAILPNRRTWLLLWLRWRSLFRTAAGKTTGGGSRLS